MAQKNAKTGHFSRSVVLHRFATTLEIFWLVKLLEKVSPQRFRNGYLQISKIIILATEAYIEPCQTSKTKRLTGF